MNRIGLGCAGAVAGAAVGYGIFMLVLWCGLNALMVIGLCAGMGAGMARSSGPVVPLAAGVIAAVAMICTMWSIAPFIADPGLGYFFLHAHQMARGDLLLTIVGVVAAVWLAWNKGPAQGGQTKAAA